MIINSLWAENVLKYSTLKLDDIPAQGLIAVIGDNESGKSSIGESVCFALFGRTFSLEPKDLDKVIRWGESRCSIKLDFTTPNGQRYQVARFLDELGNHGASISRAGEEPMVRGVDEVQVRLKDIIGFGYSEFIESFYLAQREITTPHPHSYAVKAMAGVDALEKVVTVLPAGAGAGAEADPSHGEGEGRYRGASRGDRPPGGLPGVPGGEARGREQRLGGKPTADCRREGTRREERPDPERPEAGCCRLARGTDGGILQPAAHSRQKTCNFWSPA